MSRLLHRDRCSGWAPPRGRSSPRAGKCPPGAEGASGRPVDGAAATTDWARVRSPEGMAHLPRRQACQRRGISSDSGLTTGRFRRPYRPPTAEGLIHRPATRPTATRFHSRRRYSAESSPGAGVPASRPARRAPPIVATTGRWSTGFALGVVGIVARRLGPCLGSTGTQNSTGSGHRAGHPVG